MIAEMKGNPVPVAVSPAAQAAFPVLAGLPVPQGLRAFRVFRASRVPVG